MSFSLSLREIKLFFKKKIVIILGKGRGPPRVCESERVRGEVRVVRHGR